MFSLLWALEGKLSLCFWHVHGFNQWKRVVIQMISNKIRHITAFHYCNQTSHQRIKEHQTHQQISIPAISLHHLFPKVFRPFILIPAKKRRLQLWRLDPHRGPCWRCQCRDRHRSTSRTGPWVTGVTGVTITQRAVDQQHLLRKMMLLHIYIY